MTILSGLLLGLMLWVWLRFWLLLLLGIVGRAVSGRESCSLYKFTSARVLETWALYKYALVEGPPYGGSGLRLLGDGVPEK